MRVLMVNALLFSSFELHSLMRLLLSIFDNSATLQQPSQRCQGLIENFYHLLTISRSVKTLFYLSIFFSTLGAASYLMDLPSHQMFFTIQIFMSLT